MSTTLSLADSFEFGRQKNEKALAYKCQSQKTKYHKLGDCRTKQQNNNFA